MPPQDEFTTLHGAEGIPLYRFFFFFSLNVLLFYIIRLPVLVGTFQHLFWHTTLLIQMILDPWA